MKITRFVFLFIILIILLPFSLGALDFGLLLHQYGEYGDYAEEDNFYEYRASVVPGISSYFGSGGSFFLSGSMTFWYNNDGFYHIPELLRTELSFNSKSLGLKLGRFQYSDPLGIVADSLFDGLQFTHGSRAGRFSLGAWYTGFLYKENANIIMTAEDQTLYDTVFEYDNFSKTYFAPKRALASIEWEHPAVGNLLQLKTSALGQMDLSKNDNKYHSQYFTLKAGIPGSRLLLEFGGSIEAAQTQTVNNEISETSDLKIKLAFTGEAGIYLMFPASFDSMLSITGLYSSGEINDLFGAFVPVTTKYYGEIFQAKMSGISIVELNYSARFANSFGVSVKGLYFLRNDLVTPNSFYTEDSKNYLLGGEIFARLFWSPVSDVSFNLGGGAFFPSWGDIWSDEKVRWRVDLTLILALH